MAREYIPKYIRQEVWKRITSVIRDYQKLKSEYNSIAADEKTSLLGKEIKRKLEAFDKAYNNSTPEVRELVRQRFWDKRIYRDILMPMSERTMQRYIRKFILDVGRNLGEI